MLKNAMFYLKNHLGILRNSRLALWQGLKQSSNIQDIFTLSLGFLT